MVGWSSSSSWARVRWFVCLLLALSSAEDAAMREFRQTHQALHKSPVAAALLGQAREALKRGKPGEWAAFLEVADNEAPSLPVQPSAQQLMGRYRAVLQSLLAGNRTASPPPVRGAARPGEPLTPAKPVQFILEALASFFNAMLRVIFRGVPTLYEAFMSSKYKSLGCHDPLSTYQYANSIGRRTFPKTFARYQEMLNKLVPKVKKGEQCFLPPPDFEPIKSFEERQGTFGAMWGGVLGGFGYQDPVGRGWGPNTDLPENQFCYTLLETYMRMCGAPERMFFLELNSTTTTNATNATNATAFAHNRTSTTPAPTPAKVGPGQSAVNSTTGTGGPSPANATLPAWGVPFSPTWTLRDAMAIHMHARDSYDTPLQLRPTLAGATNASGTDQNSTRRAPENNNNNDGGDGDDGDGDPALSTLFLQQGQIEDMVKAFTGPLGGTGGQAQDFSFPLSEDVAASRLGGLGALDEDDDLVGSQLGGARFDVETTNSLVARARMSRNARPGLPSIDRVLGGDGASPIARGMGGEGTESSESGSDEDGSSSSSNRSGGRHRQRAPLQTGGGTRPGTPLSPAQPSRPAAPARPMKPFIMKIISTILKAVFKLVMKIIILILGILAEVLVPLIFDFLFGGFGQILFIMLPLFLMRFVPILLDGVLYAQRPPGFSGPDPYDAFGPDSPEPRPFKKPVMEMCYRLLDTWTYKCNVPHEY